MTARGTGKPNFPGQISLRVFTYQDLANTFKISKEFQSREGWLAPALNKHITSFQFQVRLSNQRGQATLIVPPGVLVNWA